MEGHVVKSGRVVGDTKEAAKAAALKEAMSWIDGYWYTHPQEALEMGHPEWAVRPA